MNDNNRSPIPMTSIDERERKPFGALVGSLVVLIILVLSGIYLWTTRIVPRMTQKGQTIIQTNTETVLPPSDTSTKKLSTQSKSDTVSDIEKDLKATNLDNLDKEIQAL